MIGAFDIPRIVLLVVIGAVIVIFAACQQIAAQYAVKLARCEKDNSYHRNNSRSDNEQNFIFFVVQNDHLVTNYSIFSIFLQVFSKKLTAAYKKYTAVWGSGVMRSFVRIFFR